jgi:hypothetical protein
MSNNISYLHSHSGIERFSKDKEITNKSHVLVDEKFISMFDDMALERKPTKFNGTKYYKVPIMAFVRKGGVFKNLDR